MSFTLLLNPRRYLRSFYSNNFWNKDLLPGNRSLVYTSIPSTILIRLFLEVNPISPVREKKGQNPLSSLVDEDRRSETKPTPHIELHGNLISKRSDWVNGFVYTITTTIIKHITCQCSNTGSSTLSTLPFTKVRNSLKVKPPTFKTGGRFVKTP